jgi:hypothetical protein
VDSIRCGGLKMTKGGGRGEALSGTAERHVRRRRSEGRRECKEDGRGTVLRSSDDEWARGQRCRSNGLQPPSPAYSCVTPQHRLT